MGRKPGIPTEAKAAVLTLGIAVAHWVLMIVAFGAAIAPELGGTPRWWAVPLGHVWFPLAFPASVVIGRWVPSLIELSNEATFAITAGTSLLWGASITALWLVWRSRRRRFRAVLTARVRPTHE
jgi:hypothetical protein